MELCKSTMFIQIFNLNIVADCAKKLAGALFLVGEIGGNDYNYGFLQGFRSIDAMKAYVPQVINAIMDVAKVRDRVQ
jgi:hypothetical protein